MLSWYGSQNITAKYTFIPLDHCQPKPLIQGMIEPCFQIYFFSTSNFNPTIWMLQQKSRLTSLTSNIFLIFCCPILVILCKLQPRFPSSLIITWVCFQYFSRFFLYLKEMQKSISEYISLHKWLFDLLLPSFQLEAIWPFSSDHSKAFSLF